MSAASGTQINRIRSKLDRISQICRGIRTDLITIKAEA